jgi:hypothetical protein
MKNHPCDSDSSEPPDKGQGEGQPAKKRRLSGFEMAGIIIFALASLWLARGELIGTKGWSDWSFDALVFLSFCTLVWWLLFGRYNKH